MSIRLTYLNTRARAHTHTAHTYSSEPSFSAASIPRDRARFTCRLAPYVPVRRGVFSIPDVYRADSTSHGYLESSLAVYKVLRYSVSALRPNTRCSLSIALDMQKETRLALTYVTIDCTRPATHSVARTHHFFLGHVDGK